MTILPVPFAVATYFGIWEPINFTHRWKKQLYYFFTAFVLIMIYTVVALQLVEAAINFFKYKGISETLYLLLTRSAICYKAVALLIRKRDIISLSKMLLNKHCVLQNSEENAIQKRFDDTHRYITIIYLAIVFCDISLIATAPLLQTSDDRKLPNNTWLPYNIQDLCNYWLSYAHQMTGAIFSGGVNVAFDTIVTGFMWQACAQFDILEHRFETLPELVKTARSEMTSTEANDFERSIFIRFSQHHDYIHRYVKSVVETFSSIIFVQVCTSAAVITVSVYQLSMSNPENVDFAKVLVYLIAMLVEFFMYCWFGNEVTLKSTKFAENVYRSNWMILNLRSWKMMLFLIHRSTKPIVISCYNVAVLSLQTYVQVLKLSYSAYNVLRSFNGN